MNENSAMNVRLTSIFLLTLQLSLVQYYVYKAFDLLK